MRERESEGGGGGMLQRSSMLYEHIKRKYFAPFEQNQFDLRERERKKITHTFLSYSECDTDSIDILELMATATDPVNLR